MMTPEERYRRDVDFKVLVDYMTAAIERCQYTPTELREAAILAATRHAMHQQAPMFKVVLDPTIPPDEIELRTANGRMRLVGLAP